MFNGKTSRRRSELKRYFAPLGIKRPIKYAGICILIAWLCAVGRLTPLRDLTLYITACLVCWMAYRFWRFKWAISDEEVDAYLAEGLNQLVRNAYSKLGISKEELEKDPLILLAPNLWNVRGVDPKERLYRRGRDKKERFSVYTVTIFLLGKHTLGAYRCNYNFLRDTPLGETTDEYHYRDVVSVKTEEVSSNRTLPDGKRSVLAQAFRLSVASGEHIEVVIDTFHVDDSKENALPSTEAERVVGVIRSMLRDKKAGP
jgi:hypothetical protein